MRSILVGLVVCGLVIPQVAFAQSHHHRDRPGYGRHYSPDRYHHDRYHHRPRKPNYGAIIGGAIAAGVIGAIIIDQYGRRCVNRVVDYDIYGNPVVRTVC